MKPMSEADLKKMVGKTITFINPQGRENTCTVTDKGVAGLLKLQQDGYQLIKS